MLPCLARAACLAITLVAGTAKSGELPDDLANFNAAVEAAESHNRVAVGYLRTGNVDLASIELDRLREAWRTLAQRFAGKRPDVFEGNAFYIVAMTDISTRLITADLMLNSGHPEVARQSLLAIRNDLYRLRKSAGIAVLADCVYDANATMDALMGYDDRALDWTSTETRLGIASMAASYGSLLERCDGMAGDAVSKSPEFRRLIDGAKSSLTLIPKAVATRDGDLLHRVLIELRSFDNLLAFRFG